MNETAAVSSASSETPLHPSAKQKSGFITGDPRVPTLVRVYGAIIAGLSFAGMIFTLLLLLMQLLVVGHPHSLFTLAIAAVIAFVLYRSSRGLCNGERQAVYGICILGGLALLLAIGIMVRGSAVGGIILLAFVAFLYGPPILVAFHRWESFK